VTPVATGPTNQLAAILLAAFCLQGESHGYKNVLLCAEKIITVQIGHMIIDTCFFYVICILLVYFHNYVTQNNLSNSLT